MIADLIKAKQTLNKPFCFMEWQANDARVRGESPMDASDIEFLLSLESLKQGDIVSFESNKEGAYDSIELFTVIEQAINNGKQGLRISCATLTNVDEEKLRTEGFFIVMAGHGSVSWDEIYFTEEAHIRSQISSFKNLFGGIKKVAPMI